MIWRFSLLAALSLLAVLLIAGCSTQQNQPPAKQETQELSPKNAAQNGAETDQGAAFPPAKGVLGRNAGCGQAQGRHGTKVKALKR